MKNVLDQHVGLFTHWLEITLGISSIWKKVVSFWPVSVLEGFTIYALETARRS